MPWYLLSFHCDLNAEPAPSVFSHARLSCAWVGQRFVHANFKTDSLAPRTAAYQPVEQYNHSTFLSLSSATRGIHPQLRLTWTCSPHSRVRERVPGPWGQGHTAPGMKKRRRTSIITKEDLFWDVYCRRNRWLRVCKWSQSVEMTLWRWLWLLLVCGWC